jgi:hypothetical protein
VTSPRRGGVPPRTNRLRRVGERRRLRADLAASTAEIAVAVARCPLLVLTGLGHRSTRASRIARFTRRSRPRPVAEFRRADRRRRAMLSAPSDCRAAPAVFAAARERCSWRNGAPARERSTARRAARDACRGDRPPAARDPDAAARRRELAAGLRVPAASATLKRQTVGWRGRGARPGSTESARLTVRHASVRWPGGLWRGFRSPAGRAASGCARPGWRWASDRTTGVRHFASRVEADEREEERSGA